MPLDEIPSDLQVALAAEPLAAKAFDDMPPNHRREHARFISEAKKADTRERRITWSIEQIRQRAEPKRAHGQA